MQGFIVVSFPLVVFLAMLDTITTKFALAKGCYEMNPFVRTFLLNDHFLELKLILTILSFSGMLFPLSGHERLLKICCITVIAFYTIVVLNNTVTMLGPFDFGFDMPKLTLLAFPLFLLTFKAILGSQRRP